MLKLYQVRINRLLINKTKYCFSLENQISQIRNNNLRFYLDGWILCIFPFHPQIYKRANNVYEIKKGSTVLSLTFVPRITGLPQDQAWQSRKSMTFKFIDLAKLINIKAGFGGSQTIQSSKQYNGVEQIKTFSIIDNVQKQQPSIQLSLKSSLKYPSDKQPKLQFQLFSKLPYADYNLISQLIQNSLCDLSGWKFMLDIQRKKLLEGIQHNDHIKNDLDLLTDDLGLKKI